MLIVSFAASALDTASENSNTNDDAMAPSAFSFMSDSSADDSSSSGFQFIASDTSRIDVHSVPDTKESSFSFLQASPLKSHEV